MRSLALPIGALLLCALSAPVWLGWMGGYLQSAGPPEKADAILVLAGDSSGNRILKAAELARQGYAPQVVVSGPSGNYGHYESELAIGFAQQHGYPAGLFIAAPNDSRSTAEEAGVMLKALRSRGIRRFLLVTSDTHTRRAGGVYRRMAPDLQMRVVAAPSAEFDLRQWWREREGRKAVFFEWLKTVADWFRI